VGQFRLPRNKLLSFVLMFDALIYVVLIGLSYGISDPTPAAEVHTHTHARTNAHALT
jgi:hypothetical protein